MRGKQGRKRPPSPHMRLDMTGGRPARSGSRGRGGGAFVDSITNRSSPPESRCLNRAPPRSSGSRYSRGGGRSYGNTGRSIET